MNDKYSIEKETNNTVSLTSGYWGEGIATQGSNFGIVEKINGATNTNTPGQLPTSSGYELRESVLQFVDNRLLDRPPAIDGCVFSGDFDIHKNWSGGFELRYSSAKVSDGGTEAEAYPDVDEINAWVWYNNQWVSLRTDNPDGLFQSGEVSDHYQQTFGYFTFRMNQSGSGDSLRFIPTIVIKLAKSEISDNFIYLSKSGKKRILHIIATFTVTNTNDAPQSYPNNTATFKNIYLQEQTVQRIFYSKADNYSDYALDGAETYDFPMHTQDPSGVGTGIKLYRKSSYANIGYYDYESEDINKYYSDNNTKNNGMFKIASWNPYRRIAINMIRPETIATSMYDWHWETFHALVETNGSNLTIGYQNLQDAIARAKLIEEKKIIGIIMQASGGNGGSVETDPHHGSDGYGGGGGGAYVEMLVNLYKHKVVIETGIGRGQGDSNLYVYDANNRLVLRVLCEAGKNANPYQSTYDGGQGGKIYTQWNGTQPIMVAPDGYFPPYGGDRGGLSWLTSSYTEKLKWTGEDDKLWDKCVVAMSAWTSGGNGGRGGFKGTQEMRPGEITNKNGTYKLNTIINPNETTIYEIPVWSYYADQIRENQLKPAAEEEANGIDATYATCFNENSGKLVGSAGLADALLGSGGGGGASYLGKGGKGCGGYIDTKPINGYNGVRGGGGGGGGGFSGNETRSPGLGGLGFCAILI